MEDAQERFLDDLSCVVASSPSLVISPLTPCPVSLIVSSLCFPWGILTHGLHLLPVESRLVALSLTVVVEWTLVTR